MRALRPLLVAGFLLTAWLLAGCDKTPERMKNQPTNLQSGETKIHLPDRKRDLDASR